MTSDEATLRGALQAIAPGTALREGLDRIQRSHTGALIVMGMTPEIEAMCSGGFELDVEFSASALRELCKIHGASSEPTFSCFLIRPSSPMNQVCVIALRNAPHARLACPCCHCRHPCV